MKVIHCFIVMAFLILPQLAFAGGVTMDDYLAIDMGMSYEKVVSILGPPTEEQGRTTIARVTTVSYLWEGNGFGANMSIMFQNNKAVNKVQFGLK